MPHIYGSRRALLNAAGATVAPTPAFNPADYGTVAWWFDFSDNAVVLNNSDAPATDNQEIKTCTDKSGNSRNATKGPNGGVFKTAVQNGLSVAQFTKASSQRMTIGSATGVANNQAGLTLVIVYRMMSNDTQGGLIQIEDNAFGDRFIAYYESTWALGTNNVYNESGTADASLTWYIAVFRAGYAEGNASIFINNVSRLNAAISTGNTPANNSSSAPMIAAGSSGGAYPADVQIGDIIMYQGALSTGNRQGVQTALASKWGITIA